MIITYRECSLDRLMILCPEMLSLMGECQAHMKQDVTDEQETRTALPALALQELVPAVEAEEQRDGKDDVKGMRMQRFVGERETEIERPNGMKRSYRTPNHAAVRGLPPMRPIKSI